jgi:HD-GYP domain-containing protein (c-di-GMP phosphodiesterase class II)
MQRASRAPSPAVFDALADAMASRDGLTHVHAERVQHYAIALARQVPITDTGMIAALETAALLHDLGKLGIPDRLLHKPGPLTPAEYAQVKQHAIIGSNILATIPSAGLLAQIVRHHHENWDGSGYPDGLRGTAIPLASRVLAIVDCYDALTSDRPYRRALAHNSAVAMIFERRGTMYDPAITDAFLQIAWRFQPAALGGRSAYRPSARVLRRVAARGR